MRSRVTVVSLSVSMYRFLSVTAVSATYMIFESKMRYHWVLCGVLQICNVWFSLRPYTEFWRP